MVEFTVIDSIRNLERINQPSAKKYVILTKLNLSFLFTSGLIYWNRNNKLAINVDREKFEAFLSKMKDMLDTIKNLYTLDEQTINDEETRFLANLDIQMQENISKMMDLIK